VEYKEVSDATKEPSGASKQEMPTRQIGSSHKKNNNQTNKIPQCLIVQKNRKK